jgi:hypothetical protein
MKIMHVMASLLLVSSLATPTTAQERTHKSVTRSRHTGSRAAKSQLHPGGLHDGPRPKRSRDTGMRSDVQSSATHDIRERENMHQHRIQPGNAKTLLRLLIGIRMARLSLFSAVALGISLLFPLSLFTHRNACRGKATFIASTKHRSRVSGQHQASAAAL